ncbi:auxin response factor 10 [Impatiens glandulifera]|uniref:auxin response factor 10 n=1 Tax=Impatiens glandulifera TaxID=253017 RepID=UPI001FB10061|nr:auxin response factor 10 [Impatiens glandulifera]XP_047321640.1 auxin response factor 10 [Impatiens glandulifera]
MKEAEKNLDPRLWHACAGGMVQVPPVNSKVFYFPQGHAEHTLSPVDFGAFSRIPSLIPCRITAIKFMADSETDEVYAKIRLIPLNNNDLHCDDDVVTVGSNNESESTDKPASFAKTLTQSDANNGGGFSVPRYCAETIFPHLDYSTDPPVQTIVVKDVHGVIWKFRHIYRGTPKRHLLTTGWSTFVNQKKLVAGDSIVFLRSDNGDLCVGIRRAKRRHLGSGESPIGWSSASASSNCVSQLAGFSVFLRDDENKTMRNVCKGNQSSGFGSKRGGGGRVRAESVVEAASLASNGHPFEVVYYPCANTPEFCVKVSSVKSSMRIQWSTGMRFKMPFETEDSSRISWFMGTIASVQVVDPINWPNSPWRILQVTWDEPDLLQNVKRVSPWLVELVSNMMPPPLFNISTPFSPPPRKKLCFPHYSDFPPSDGQLSVPVFSSNPLRPSSSLFCRRQTDINIPAGGIQGARHAQFGIPLMDLNLNLANKLRSSFFQSNLHSPSSESDPHGRISCGSISVQSLLTTKTDNCNAAKSDTDNVTIRKPQFILFGQPILTEQQIIHTLKEEKAENFEFQSLDNSGHCKVFVESFSSSSEEKDDAVLMQTLDLSVLGSYQELYKKLSNMFAIETSCRVIYQDATGIVRPTGAEPFSDFTKSAKKLIVQMDSSSAASRREMKWVTGFANSEHGRDSKNRTGPQTIILA